MSVRPYSPENEPASSAVGIVLFNHMGSCVLGDTGRDAQHMANTTRLHVIAADRPGSGLTYPGQDRRLARDYVSAVSRLAERRIMPEIEAMGLSRVIIVGRSAGGLAALTAVCTEQLPAVGLNAQEAVGWTPVTAQQGKQTFDTYQAKQKAMLTNTSLELVRPEPTDQTGWRKWARTATILSTAPVDRANNKRVWSQDLAMIGAFTVAARHPNVRTDLVFAEHSMVVSPRDVQYLQHHLPLTRRPDDAPITVRTEPHTVHASFDLRNLSARLVAATAAAVLDPPAS